MIVVCASGRPRSAIISTRSRRLSLNRRYHRTHTMMTSRSKWRPSNNSSMLLSLLIADLLCVQLASVADRAGGFAPEPAQVLAECDVHGVCVLGAQPVDLCAQPRSRCRLEARRRRQIKKIFFLSAVALYASSGMAEPFSSCHPV